MDLAINALTNCWCPEENYAHWFYAGFSRNKPIQFLDGPRDAYLNIPPKLIEALVLCRLGTGSVQGAAIDTAILDRQLAMIEEDGLTYCRENDLPWYLEEGNAYDEKGVIRENAIRNYSDIWAEGRMLITLSLLAQIDASEKWKEIAQKKVDRLLELSEPHVGYLRFTELRHFKANVPLDERGTQPFDTFDDPMKIAYAAGALGHGAGLLYQISGYEPAFTLLKGLAKWVLDEIFCNDDGSFTLWHFHHGLYALIALCQYGITANDRGILERVDVCYNYMKQLGDGLVGFFPELVPGSTGYLHRRGNTAETCEIADMIVLALWLTKAGIGDYWEDVDRWTRNMFAESQISSNQIFDRIPLEYYPDTQPDHPYFTAACDVSDKIIGAFLGWMRTNEGIEVVRTDRGGKVKGVFIMNCCTGNGSRTLYYLWDSIIQQTEDWLCVNLLLNRTSKWLDVKSWIPFEGKVELDIKIPKVVKIRIPNWCKRTSIQVAVNKKQIKTVIQDGMIVISCLKTNDRVTIRFDITEYSTHRIIGEIPYKLRIRGNDVMEVWPKGVACPLFEDKVFSGMTERDCFIPENKDLIW
jgi:hypothetical protein